MCVFCEIITFSNIIAWVGVGLGLVWLGLARCCLVELLYFPTILLGLGLVWRCVCVFCEVITFSNRIAWFGIGLGLAWFGSVLVGGTVVFSKDSAWFGLGLGLVWLGLAMCVCFVKSL